MNLHQPRTTKRCVLFLGVPGCTADSWSFRLNPLITWDDVSLETKLRLKTLVQETEAAFLQKYPDCQVSQWENKTQKYQLPGSEASTDVRLADMVYSLQVRGVNGNVPCTT